MKRKHSYFRLCHVPRQPDMPHYIGQNILVNNGKLYFSGFPTQYFKTRALLQRKGCHELVF